MEEPSVLDYVKSKLMPWKGVKIEIPALREEAEAPEVGLEADEEQPLAEAAAPGEAVRGAREPVRWPWRVLLALVLTLLAQRMLEPPDRNAMVGIVMYALAGAFMVWAVVIKEWQMDFLSEDSEQPMPMTVRRNPALLAAGAAVLAFIAFGGNKFTFVNLFLWTLGIVYLFWALWLKPARQGGSSLWKQLEQFTKNPILNVRITPWRVMMTLSIALVVFFRFYNLEGMPGEMISDHAEKLLDVNNVLNGQYNIFFPRNTGREFVQMYLTAAVALLSGSGLSFMSLKIGTALAGLLTLPYIYLLGKEVGGRWVGFLAFLLAGIAYWPNVIARIGLRFPLYPLFAAPLLFYLVRGLRRQNRNDFIWAGIALGLGLHGYSPMRIVPFVVVLLVILYLLHRQARGKQTQVMVALIILAVAALIIFLPLGRYALDDPEMFGLRAFSRLGTTERAYPGPVGEIFLSNLAKAWIMPFWDDGEIWVHSVPHRPALDLVTAVMYFLGTVWLVVRYVRRRHWLDLFLLISVPLLMMPSILSLAFPAENPSLNRTGAAYIPIFVTAALGMHSLFASLKARTQSAAGRGAIYLLVLLLLAWSASQNYDLAFNKFGKTFFNSTWNTSQIAGVIRQFASTVGTPDTAYVVPYSHWVDTRVVGIRVGIIEKDYALWPDAFTRTLAEKRPQLFILKPDDKSSLATLQQMYPTGNFSIYKSDRAGKDFVMFYVPSR